MSKIEIRHPDKPASAGPVSAGVLCDGWLFVSGQTPADPRTGKVTGTTIEEQTRATLGNIDKILKAGGCSRQDVVKCGCHLADMKDFERFSRTYAEFFSGSPVMPARITVQSGMAGILVEIDAIARAPGKS